MSEVIQNHNCSKRTATILYAHQQKEESHVDERQKWPFRQINKVSFSAVSKCFAMQIDDLIAFVYLFFFLLARARSPHMQINFQTRFTHKWSFIVSSQKDKLFELSANFTLISIWALVHEIPENFKISTQKNVAFLLLLLLLKTNKSSKRYGQYTRNVCVCHLYGIFARKLIWTLKRVSDKICRKKTKADHFLLPLEMLNTYKKNMKYLSDLKWLGINYFII